jgi:filamentous hemagglutinin
LTVIDAGDAGIRATGNLNIAVLNASNISIGGTSAGTPSAPSVSAPNILSSTGPDTH